MGNRQMTDRKTIEATVLIMALIIILIGGQIWIWGGAEAHAFTVGFVGGAFFSALKAIYENKKGPGE